MSLSPIETASLKLKKQLSEIKIPEGAKPFYAPTESMMDENMKKHFYESYMSLAQSMVNQGDYKSAKQYVEYAETFKTTRKESD